MRETARKLYIEYKWCRKIEYFAVTEQPAAQWMIQQIRVATPFGKKPKYLIHDNGSMFKDKLYQQFLSHANIVSKDIAPHSPWQDGICERLLGIIRRELFDHIIPFNQQHMERLLSEYAKYYNNIRTHQSLDGRPPNLPSKPPRTTIVDTKLSKML